MEQRAVKWHKKYVGGADYRTDQKMFRDVVNASSEGLGLIMLAGEDGSDVTLYIRLPDTFGGFDGYGYEPSGPPNEPRIIGLVGTAEELAEFTRM